MARTLTGTVISDKPDKSIVVNVQSTKTHPIYRKRYVIGKHFMAHDENNEAKEGDKVVISETRPISAKKHFTLTNIVEKATVQHVEAEPESRKAVKKAQETEVPEESTEPEKKAPTKKPTAKAKKQEEAE